jgi:cupin 2 domain-containing protein
MKSLAVGNLLETLPDSPQIEEKFEPLVRTSAMLIERIVSTGQVTPEGEWYDQERDEWVMVLSGAARLRIEGEDEDRELAAGDWIHLPAHCRHRVTWTDDAPCTIWLAVHFPSD